MPKRDIPRELEELAQLRHNPDAAVTALPKALKDPVNVIVARAAKVAADLQLRALAPDLLRAYDRLFTDTPKKDPQCTAKTALAQALKQLGWSEAAPFLRAVRYVQLEPVWGGQEDSAATLRGTCVLALSQCTDIPHAEILRHAVDALADRFVVVRSDAVRAIAESGGIDSALLLRLKARLGDEDPRITGETLESLIAIEGEAGVALATEFLSHPREDVQDEAALALGASRHPSAVAALIERWRTASLTGQSAVLLRALGIARDERATAVLLDCLRKGRPRDASAALDALTAQAQNDSLRSAIFEALEARADEDLLRLARQRLG